MMGSAPRTYLMVRPGYLLGRSLLMNAATCGYAPSRHPHTSRMAFSYLVFSSEAEPPSSVQHLTQSAATLLRSNCLRSSQEEHSSLAELNPLARHSAVSSLSEAWTMAQSSMTTSWLTIMEVNQFMARLGTCLENNES